MANENAPVTAEQIAAAQAILYAANQQASNPASSVVQEESTDEKADGTDTTNTVTVDQLRVAFEAAMVSDIYLGNPKRLERLLESLKIPMANEKDLNQFLNHAKKELYVAAVELAVKNGAVPALPTPEEIMVLAQTKMAAKKAAKTTK